MEETTASCLDESSTPSAEESDAVSNSFKKAAAAFKASTSVDSITASTCRRPLESTVSTRVMLSADTPASRVASLVRYCSASKEAALSASMVALKVAAGA